MISKLLAYNDDCNISDILLLILKKIFVNANLLNGIWGTNIYRENRGLG